MGSVDLGVGLAVAVLAAAVDRGTADTGTVGRRRDPVLDTGPDIWVNDIVVVESDFNLDSVVDRGNESVLASR